MTCKFGKLLRSNFRCGRMLCSRAIDMAGRFGVSAARCQVQPLNP